MENVLVLIQVKDEEGPGRPLLWSVHNTGQSKLVWDSLCMVPQLKILKHKKNIVFVGIAINMFWILGKWIKELHKIPNTKIIWTFSSYSKNSVWRNKWVPKLPEASLYFFSYISLFRKYLDLNPSKFQGKSVVLYTHDEGNIGSSVEQSLLLNNALSVHFNCSKDAERLVSAGLKKEKVRIVFGAVDDSCKRNPKIRREEKTILLASRFSQRKGLNILPEIISLMPEWKFIILGRGWRKFLKKNQLLKNNQICYKKFNIKNRNKYMNKAQIFLSLSNLEGGPIPLIESMTVGVIPVATNTGFARDVIQDGKNGIILNMSPKPEDVVAAIYAAAEILPSTTNSVSKLTWERMRNILQSDLMMAQENVE